jgi:hypothetical protein
VIFESSCRTAPAAALRGLTKVFSPFAPLAIFSRWRSLSCSNWSRRMYTSPRTSSTSGTPSGRRSGICADGAHVVGHVLAGLAVTARGGPHQHALLVAQAHGQPVELELGQVVDGRIGPRSA